MYKIDLKQKIKEYKDTMAKDDNRISLVQRQAFRTRIGREMLKKAIECNSIYQDIEIDDQDKINE